MQGRADGKGLADTGYLLLLRYVDELVAVFAVRFDVLQKHGHQLTVG